MIRLLESKPFLFFFRDHLRSTLRITCGRGSFAVHFGDHLRSRDHLRLGIICGTVHISMEFLNSYLSRQFAGKPLVASRNVSCFQRLGYLFVSEVKKGQVKITH